MGLKTAQEYFDRFKKVKAEVYHYGQKLEDIAISPVCVAGIGNISLLYTLARDPEIGDIFSCESRLLPGEGQSVCTTLCLS